MKVLPTCYQGQNFRSRLEARWAVFFDYLSIKWVYEPEGYDLGDGVWYLPDFYLSDFNHGVFAEVKPDGGDFTKAILFGKQCDKGIWLCEGNPDLKIYKFVDEVEDDTVIPNYLKAYKENRFWWGADACDLDLDKFIDSKYEEGILEYLHAVSAAKNYKFH